MHTSLVQHAEGADGLDVTACLNFVIVFEDVATGRRAKYIYDSLASQLGKMFAFEQQTWKFSVLNEQRLRELAARDAAAADIIILACHGDGDLPAEVKSWIDLWAGRNGGPKALVVLFDGQPGQAQAAIRAYLEAVARQADMDFFAEPEGASQRSGQPLVTRSPLLN